MKITIQIDYLSIDLSADALEAVVSGLPDTEEYRDVYAALAHPASVVRLQVACKDQLTEESVALLAKDVSPEVRRNVLRTSAGRAHLDETTLHDTRREYRRRERPEDRGHRQPRSPQSHALPRSAAGDSHARR